MNVGMGHSFLKHVERTKLLLMIVDVHGFRLSERHQHRSAFETLLLLMKELQLYSEEVAKKPALLALNKTDLPDADLRLGEIMAQLDDIDGAASLVDERIRPTSLMNFDAVVPI